MLTNLLPDSPQTPQPTSFEALFEENMGRLWRLALRLCNSREDAEDLLQEAAVIGFRSFKRFEAGSNFTAWMGTIMVNAHRNRLRFDSRRVSTVSLDTVGEDTEVGENILYELMRAQGKSGRAGDPAGRLFDSLDSTLITEAFRSLPPEYRECCALFWVYELPYDQIAQVLNVPIGTVRSRLHRGRKLLQRALSSLASERGIIRGNLQKPGTSSSQSNLLQVVLFMGTSLVALKMR